ncbi:hypothetical protein J6590_072362 [Homalodisca vitripennis]|nr:hypothetical protein J6590_072362 [Homalodisca vitripennis]
MRQPPLDERYNNMDVKIGDLTICDLKYSKLYRATEEAVVRAVGLTLFCVLQVWATLVRFLISTKRHVDLGSKKDRTEWRVCRNSERIRAQMMTVHQSPKRLIGHETDEQPIEQCEPQRDCVSQAETSHDPRNKLTQPGQITIKDYFPKGHENRILKSKLSVRAADLPLNKDLVHVCHAAVKEITQTAETMSEKATNQPVRPSYMAAVAPPVTVQGLGRKVSRPRGDKCTAPIYPKDSTPNTSSETTKALQVAVKPKSMGLKIRIISKIRNNGVTLEDLDGKTLREVVYAQDNEREDCTLDNFDNSFKPLFKTGPRNKPSNNWVCEVSAEIRNSLVRTGCVFIAWASCKNNRPPHRDS